MQVVISKAAARALSRSNKRELIARKIKELAASPESMSGNVTRLRGRSDFRLRVQDWRVIFRIEGDILYVDELEPRFHLRGSNMTAQIVEIAGQKIVMLPVADYERLLELAEDQADVAAAERAEQRRLAGEEYVPFELVDRIINGENAVRVWRLHRGMTQAQLAGLANARKSTISEIESGKAQGKPALWRALAKALNVTVDDILPSD